MIKEQIIVLKIKYDPDEHDMPHEWDWNSLTDQLEPIEVIAYGVPIEVKENDDE